MTKHDNEWSSFNKFNFNFDKISIIEVALEYTNDSSIDLVAKHIATEIKKRIKDLKKTLRQA